MEQSGVRGAGAAGVPPAMEIRLLERAYLEAARRLHNDPRILDLLTDVSHVSEISQEAWFTRISTSASSRRYMIVNPETDDLMGIFRVDALDFQNRSACIGCDIDPRYQRKGVAYKAFQYFFEYFFVTCGLNRLYLVTLASNAPAIGLYRKLGMVEEGRFEKAVFRAGHFQDLVQFRLLGREYIEASAKG